MDVRSLDRPVSPHGSGTAGEAATRVHAHALSRTGAAPGRSAGEPVVTSNIGGRSRAGKEIPGSSVGVGARLPQAGQRIPCVHVQKDPGIAHGNLPHSVGVVAQEATAAHVAGQLGELGEEG